MTRWRQSALSADGELRAPLEEDEQATYFRWTESVSFDGRVLRPHVHHIANGGSRRPAEAAKLMGQGVTPGVPDISLEIACEPYHGLRIEMKRRGERPNAEQRKALERLTEQGYYAVACEGFEAARGVTLAYLRRRFSVVDHWMTGGEHVHGR